MNVAVLLNPRSGTAASEAQVRAAYKQLGVECEIVPLTGARGDMERAQEAAQRCDVLAAAGGDGTINAAATALVRSGSEAALGIMPLGTCNDFSRSLQLPPDITESVEVIVCGQSAPLDVICIEDGRVVINQANGGFSGVVAQELEENMKARWGSLGYWRAGLEALGEPTEYEVTAVIDGERMKVRAVNLTVANGRFSGGGVPVAPNADPSDGKMDIVILESRMRITMLPLIPRLLRGTHLESDGVVYRQATRMELFVRPDMPFSIDGEVEDEHPRRFEVLPGRLRVRVAA